jgi:hypothetical protein
LVPALAALIFSASEVGWNILQASAIAPMALWWIVALFRNKLSHRVRTYGLYVIATSGLYHNGLSSLGLLVHLSFCILTAIFLGVNKSIYAIALSLLSITAIGYGHSAGILSI